MSIQAAKPKKRMNFPDIQDILENLDNNLDCYFKKQNKKIKKHKLKSKIRNNI